MAASTPTRDLWTPRPPDAEASPVDAGICEGPEGARWDVDQDGVPAWFWTGAYSTPPAGVDPAAWDPDDLHGDASPDRARLGEGGGGAVGAPG